MQETGVHDRKLPEGVTFDPAECSRRCTDPECPYTHQDTWVVNGIHYHDLAQAIAMLPPKGFQP